MAREDRRSDGELEPGTVVAGRYRIGERLGSGAIGAVYYAEHTKVERPVAIKVMSPHWMSHRDMVERFRSEARSASAAGHPNIVEVFDAGDLDDGLPYIVMEYLPGRELYELIQEAHGMVPRRAAGYARAIARALAAAHERGVIHRDLKAENVMIIERDGEETLKVLDFGVAHIATGDSRRTTPGTVIGTPEYMAPEQIRGKAPTPAIDVYALGVLMHEMLTGGPPFTASEPIDVLAMKTAGPADPVRTKRDDIPTDLADLVDACLRPEPSDRPSAHDIARRLDAWLDRGGAAAAVAPVRSGGALGWVLVLATAAAGLGAFVMLKWREPSTPDSVVAAPSVDRSPDPLPPPTAEPDPEPAPALVPDLGPEATAAVEGSTGAPSDEPPASPPTPPDPVAKTTRVAKSKLPAVEPTPSDPEPSPAPGVASDPESSACKADRKRANDARQMQDWDGVLRYTADANCYASKLERRRLRVLALLESGRHDQCISTGRGSSDAQIQSWVSLCEKKKGA